MNRSRLAGLVLALLSSCGRPAFADLPPLARIPAALQEPGGQQQKNPYWTWTPSDQHHQAVVLVRQGNGQGSGCLVWREPDSSRGLVVTATHVIEGGQSAEVRWQDGFRASARVVAAERDSDGALLMVSPVPRDAVVVPVCREAPPVGAYVEHCGFGGPTGKLRHFWGVVAEHRGTSDTLTRSYLLNGDSGGPVLWKTDRGWRLVGANSGGHQTRDGGIRSPGSNWPLHYPAITTHCAAIHRLVARATGQQPPANPQDEAQRLARNGTQCGPGGCPPMYDGGNDQNGFINIQRNQFGGPGSAPDPYVPPPPQQQPQPQQPAPQAPTPIGGPAPIGSPCPPCPRCNPPREQIAIELDYARLAAELAKRPELRGPKGDQGPPGAEGPPGRAGAVDSTMLRDEIRRITLELSGELRGDLDARVAALEARPDRSGETDQLFAALLARVQATEAAVAEAAKPLTVRSLDGQGKVLDEVKVRPGGTLNLHHQLLPSGR